MTIRDISYVGEGLIRAPNDGPALRYDPLREENVTDIAVHQWTGWLPPETWTAGEEIAYIVRIDQYHRTTRGLDGIGYHICVFPSGRVYITARLDKYGAGVGLENNHLIHLALPGTFNLNIPSPKHLEGCREAVRYIYEYLGREVPTTPHLNWGGTTCPGDRWPEWVPQLAVPIATKKEDDMFLVTGVPSGRTFVVGAGGKLHLSQPAIDVYLFKGLEPPFEYPDEKVDAIPDCALAAHFTGSGGGGPTKGTFKGTWDG